MNYKYSTKKINSVGNSSKSIVLPMHWLKQVQMPKYLDMEIDENENLILIPHLED